MKHVKGQNLQCLSSNQKLSGMHGKKAGKHDPY